MNQTTSSTSVEHLSNSSNNNQVVSVSNSTNSVLSNVDIANNVIKASMRADRHCWLYLYIGCLPTFILSCIAWIVWGAIEGSSKQDKNSLVLKAFYIIGITSTSVTGFLLVLLTCVGFGFYSHKRMYAMLQNNVCFVVKLEGNQWVQFVEYLYGPDQKRFTFLGRIGAFTFCCCRKAHYEKLIKRGYGYIVFCERGFILDEMYRVVRDHTHHILAVKHVVGMGIRVYVLRTDADYMVQSDWTEERQRQAGLEALEQKTVPLDIYLPDTLSEAFVDQLCIQIQSGLWNQ